MHGHKFAIIGRGGEESLGGESLGGKIEDALRRDTIQVPGNSRATIRFVADNPGAWMFHCHLEVRRLLRSLDPTDLSLLVAPRIRPCRHLCRSANGNANTRPPTAICRRTVRDAWTSDVRQCGGT